MTSTAPPAASPALVSAVLAFIAGFADAATFVGADGVFCAHVTGNFVVLAADLARHASADEWLKLASFPVFVGSVVAATQLHRRLVRPSAPVLLWLEALALAAATALALFARGAPARSAIVVLAVVAMGAQNAMHRVTPTLGPMTTVMTGNVTQWLVEKARAASGGKPSGLGPVILAFALGCFGGAFGVQRLGFCALGVPTLLAAALAIHLRKR